MAITKERIWAAADELDAAGLNPTLAAVRKAVGSGSFTTIQEAITEWKARRSAKATPAMEPPPPAIAERMTELGAQIWSVAQDMAHARLAADREALAIEREQTEAERREAMELADSLSGELDQARARIASLETSEADSRAAQQQAGQRLATAEARVMSLEEQSRALISERDQAREEATSAREQAAIARGKVEALEAQLAALLARVGIGSSAS